MQEIVRLSDPDYPLSITASSVALQECNPSDLIAERTQFWIFPNGTGG